MASSIHKVPHWPHSDSAGSISPVLGCLGSASYSHLVFSVSPVCVEQHKTLLKGASVPFCAVQVGLLTPLTFAPHRLSPLAAFTSGVYFLRHGRR